MTLEERVLAAKAKLDEACDELLELVSENPGAAADIAQLLNPNAELGSVRVEHFYRNVAYDDNGAAYPIDTPLNYVYGVDRRRVEHDTENDVLVSRGSVFMILALEPEDEKASNELRAVARELRSEGLA